MSRSAAAGGRAEGESVVGGPVHQVQEDPDRAPEYRIPVAADGRELRDWRNNILEYAMGIPAPGAGALGVCTRVWISSCVMCVKTPFIVRNLIHS